MISQIAISNAGRGGRRKPPYAFTEQGVAMLSSVLNSDRAVHVNIAIMRAFVKLRANLRDALTSWLKKSRNWKETFNSTTRKSKRSSTPSASCWSRSPSPKRRIGFSA